MLDFIKVVILGIVEGITEWLPVSKDRAFDSGGRSVEAGAQR